jgi:cobalamin transport system ATP-binding protein
MTALLSAHDVRFSYGRQAVLAGVTLAVHPGEILALVGPNGAGKTTLLKLLAGLLVAHGGQVRAVGVRARTVAYLAQSEGLPADWSAREVVELGRLPYVGLWRDLTREDARAVDWAMERTETAHLAGRLVANLSGGERQRVALARALAQAPRVLLLDEPAAHLDLRHQVGLLAALRAEAARGVGVVAVLHDLAFAAQADRCVVLSQGRIRGDGSPIAVLVPDLVREVYETEIEVLRGRDGRIVIAPTRSPPAEEWPGCRKEKPTWKDVRSC